MSVRKRIMLAFGTRPEAIKMARSIEHFARGPTPVLVMRNVTERPEAVAAGAVKLLGTDREGILSAMSALLTERRAYERVAEATSPFGDGTAGERIADFLKRI